MDSFMHKKHVQFYFSFGFQQKVIGIFHNKS